MKQDVGHYVCYQEKRFNPEKLALLERASAILEEYEARGFRMTLRELYYQLVARDVIPNNTREYDRLGALLSDGRIAGLVSWTGLEDRRRNLMGLSYQRSVGGALRAAAEGYRRDLWEYQDWRPEVWVEKEALEGVVGTICNALRVDFFACCGYNSQSESWRAGRRMAGYIQKGQRPIVFHLGDHDPSGIDMTRDNQERLSLFAGVQIQVVRIALNMSQIEELRPPPNPAKVTDSRAEKYIEKYGTSSWELDALTPDYIHALIDRSVASVRDAAKWDEALRREAEDKRALQEMVEEMGG
jgi:hypothetical protein